MCQAYFQTATLAISAVVATPLRADGAHHAHDSRHDVQGLGDVLADPVQRACATRARAHLRLDHTLDAGQPAR